MVATTGAKGDDDLGANWLEEAITTAGRASFEKVPKLIRAETGESFRTETGVDGEDCDESTAAEAGFNDNNACAAPV